MLNVDVPIKLQVRIPDLHLFWAVSLSRKIHSRALNTKLQSCRYYQDILKNIEYDKGSQGLPGNSGQTVSGKSNLKEKNNLQPISANDWKLKRFLTLREGHWRGASRALINFERAGEEMVPISSGYEMGVTKIETQSNA